MKGKSWQVYVFSLLPLAAGLLVGLATGSRSQYAGLVKPPLSPPGALFPIVWTILYILMGLGFYLAWRGAEEKGLPAGRLLPPYILQLVCNLAWPLLFFFLRLYWFGSIWILLLIPAVLWMMFRFWPASPAAKLQIPYLLWCYFATYLSFATAALNP